MANLINGKYECGIACFLKYISIWHCSSKNRLTCLQRKQCRLGITYTIFIKFLKLIIVVIIHTNYVKKTFIFASRFYTIDKHITYAPIIIAYACNNLH